MNKYARFYFDITQNKDIKDTLYDTLTKKEKKNFIRYESKSNKKIDHNDDIKLDKFGMKLIEFISVLFMPFIVIVISLFLIYMMYIVDGLIPYEEINKNDAIASIGANPGYFIFGVISAIIILIIIAVNSYNLFNIFDYYYMKYFQKENFCYKLTELNYIFKIVLLLINDDMKDDYAYELDEIRNNINYRIRVKYFKLKLLKPSNLRKEVEKHENKLIDKFNTLYIDKEATHLMYEYELMRNIELLNDNESTKDLHQIIYEIDDNYIEVNKLLNNDPDSKDNDHLQALMESIHLNKSEIKSFKELVELLQNKIEVEYYSQKINLLDDEKEKMEKAEKRLNEIYQTVYKLYDEQVNAYDLRIKELEEELKDLKQQLN